MNKQTQSENNFQLETNLCHADRRAAEQGDANAQYNLGCRYRDGKDIQQDFIEAVKWLSQSARQGHAGAQFALAVCYQDGKGVSEDDTEAAKWYRQAADQGHADAQHSLGNCYFKGWGVPQTMLKWPSGIERLPSKDTLSPKISWGFVTSLVKGCRKIFRKL